MITNNSNDAKVVLLSSPENAEKLAFTAIRTCYSPLEPHAIATTDYTDYFERNDVQRLIRQIVSHGHTSTLEHLSFTFGISNVSRILLAQLTRHRIASYSVQSQRYVKQSTDSKHGTFDYIVPPSIMANKAMANLYRQQMRRTQETYDILVRNGIKAEDARYVLGGAATTNIVMTFNLRSLLHFYAERNSTTHAQWEIANLAELIREAVEQVEPWISTLFEGVIKAKNKETIDALKKQIQTQNSLIESYEQTIVALEGKMDEDSFSNKDGDDLL